MSNKINFSEKSHTSTPSTDSTDHPPLLSGEESDQQYKYYNASGIFIGKSHGESPDDSLFDKAHYVIKNDVDMIKNQDPIPVLKRDIERYRSELISVPVSNMSKIMELNHLIKNLERFIVEPEEHQVPAQHATP